jgi:CRISPR-associated protein Csy1
MQELSVEPLADAAVALAALQANRRLCASRQDLDQTLHGAARVIALHPSDHAIREFAMRFAIDAIPTRALEWLESLLATTLPHAAGLPNLSLAMPQLFDNEAAIDQWRERYRNALEQLQALADEVKPSALSLIQDTAFSLAYHGRNNLSLQSMRGDLLARSVGAITPMRAMHNTATDAPLRVGFVSKHLRDCTVGHYFRRFITDLADDQIATYTYACGSADSFTELLEAEVTVPRRFPLEPHENHSEAALVRIANVIAADALDVLIYPEIGMEPLIEKLAAMRLAPMQCALWGHPDTTGLPTIDVFFSAESMEPNNGPAHYREALHLLPGLGCAYPTPPPPEPLTRAALALPSDVPLLVCAQSSFKWRPNFLATIATILHAQTSARLVYFENRNPIAARAFSEYLGTQLHKHDIDSASRVIALQESTRSRFLATLAACDLALDTFDFSGGNTTLDSLSVGLPVVTLPGEFMRGRQSMAMLGIVGAQRLIARDAKDYAHIAATLLGDATTRHALRSHIHEHAHRLFDDTAPVAALRKWLLRERSN